MESYGATFRTFRQNKGFTLKQVATGIVSVSFLSKFERGESDVSFSVMVELLDRMMVTYEEFYFLHNAGKSNAVEEFFNAADKAYAHRDVPALIVLKKQALENYYQTNHIPFHCNALLLEVYRSMIELDLPHLENESLPLLTNYLFDIEVWGYYELRLYNATLFLLPPALVIVFSTTVYHNIGLIKDLPILHNVLISILLNTLTYLTGGQNPDFLYENECKAFITYLENSEIPENNLLARLTLFQAKGYLNIRLGITDTGTTAVKRVIAMYKELGAHKLALESTNYLHILLNNQQNNNE